MPLLFRQGHGHGQRRRAGHEDGTDKALFGSAYTKLLFLLITKRIHTKGDTGCFAHRRCPMPMPTPKVKGKGKGKGLGEHTNLRFVSRSMHALHAPTE